MDINITPNIVPITSRKRIVPNLVGPIVNNNNNNNDNNNREVIDIDPIVNNNNNQHNNNNYNNNDKNSAIVIDESPEKPEQQNYQPIYQQQPDYSSITFNELVPNITPVFNRVLHLNENSNQDCSGALKRSLNDDFVKLMDNLDVRTSSTLSNTSSVNESDGSQFLNITTDTKTIISNNDISGDSSGNNVINGTTGNNNGIIDDEESGGSDQDYYDEDFIDDEGCELSYDEEYDENGEYDDIEFYSNQILMQNKSNTTTNSTTTTENGEIKKQDNDEEVDPDPISFEPDDLNTNEKLVEIHQKVKSRNNRQRVLREMKLNTLFDKITLGAPAPYITPTKFTKRRKRRDDDGNVIDETNSQGGSISQSDSFTSFPTLDTLRDIIQSSNSSNTTTSTTTTNSQLIQPQLQPQFQTPSKYSQRYVFIPPSTPNSNTQKSSFEKYSTPNKLSFGDVLNDDISDNISNSNNNNQNTTIINNNNNNKRKDPPPPSPISNKINNNYQQQYQSQLPTTTTTTATNTISTPPPSFLPTPFSTNNTTTAVAMSPIKPSSANSSVFVPQFLHQPKPQPIVTQPTQQQQPALVIQPTPQIQTNLPSIKLIRWKKLFPIRVSLHSKLRQSLTGVCILNARRLLEASNANLNIDLFILATLRLYLFFPFESGIPKTEEGKTFQSELSNNQLISKLWECLKTKDIIETYKDISTDMWLASKNHSKKSLMEVDIQCQLMELLLSSSTTTATPNSVLASIASIPTTATYYSLSLDLLNSITTPTLVSSTIQSNVIFSSSNYKPFSPYEQLEFTNILKSLHTILNSKPRDNVLVTRYNSILPSQKVDTLPTEQSKTTTTTSSSSSSSNVQKTTTSTTTAEPIVYKPQQPTIVNQSIPKPNIVQPTPTIAQPTPLPTPPPPKETETQIYIKKLKSELESMTLPSSTAAVSQPIVDGASSSANNVSIEELKIQKLLSIIEKQHQQIETLNKTNQNLYTYLERFINWQSSIKAKWDDYSSFMTHSMVNFSFKK